MRNRNCLSAEVIRAKAEGTVGANFGLDVLAGGAKLGTPNVPGWRNWQTHRT